MRFIVEQVSKLDETKGWIFLYNHNIILCRLKSVSAYRLIRQGFAAGYQQRDLESCLKAAERLIGLGGGLDALRG